MFLTLHDSNTTREVRVNTEHIAVVSQDSDRNGTWLTLTGNDDDGNSVELRVTESYGTVVMLMGPNPHPFCEPGSGEDIDEEFYFDIN